MILQTSDYDLLVEKPINLLLVAVHLPPCVFLRKRVYFIVGSTLYSAAQLAPTLGKTQSVASVDHNGQVPEEQIYPFLFDSAMVSTQTTLLARISK